MSLISRFIELFCFFLFLQLLIVPAQAQPDISEETDSTTVYFDLATDSVFMIVNGNYSSPIKFFNDDSANFSSWIHQIELSYPFSPTIRKSIDLRNKNTFTLSNKVHEAPLEYAYVRDNFSIYELTGRNFLFSTDEDTKIFIGDSLVGKGVIAINSEQRKIKFRLELDGRIKNKRFTHNPHTFSHNSFYMRLVRKRAISYSFIPGAAQYYKREFLKSIGIATAFTFLTYQTVRSYTEFVNTKKDYESIREQYIEARVQSEALELGNQMDQLHSETNSALTRKRLFMAGTTLLYSLNILDGIFNEPRHGYRKQRSLEVDFARIEELNMLRLKYNL